MPKEDTQFKQGKSGNPKGRKPGTNTRTFFNEMMLGKRQALFEKALHMAMTGNEVMMKFICARIVPPKVKDDPISGLKLRGTIANKSNSIMKALEQERITITQAHSLMEIVSKHKENLDSAGYEPIVEILKKQGLWEE